MEFFVEISWNFCRDGKNYTGNFVIDEAILREEGMTDFSQYSCVPGQTEFMPDFFLDDFDDYVKGMDLYGKHTSKVVFKKIFENVCK